MKNAGEIESAILNILRVFRAPEERVKGETPLGRMFRSSSRQDWYKVGAIIAFEIVTRRDIPDEVLGPEVTISELAKAIAAIPVNEDPYFPVERVKFLVDSFQNAVQEAFLENVDVGSEAQ